jgi:hypothetical protein
MNADERKRTLQNIGALPPDDDALMPFPEPTGQERALSGTPMTEEEIGATSQPEPRELSGANLTESERKSAGIGQGLAAAGRSYANAYGMGIPEPPANPNDPKEKLKKLQTPEFMKWLRSKAGATGDPR